MQHASVVDTSHSLIVLLLIITSCQFISQDGEGGILKTFSTPALSIARVLVQTTGELDYNDLFLEGGLLYTPMAYILFIVFIVLLPTLFNNLLVSVIVDHKNYIEIKELDMAKTSTLIQKDVSVHGPSSVSEMATQHW